MQSGLIQSFADVSVREHILGSDRGVLGDSTLFYHMIVVQ